MAHSEFFINAVELIDFQGATNVPSVLRYEKGIRDPSFGSNAGSKSHTREELNEDFKVDLGNIRPGTSVTKQFRCADGQDRSAGTLTADFLTTILRDADSWLKARNLKTDVNLLVAEPLSMQDGLVSDNWLANYRTNIRRILSGKGFDKVDFLPEPFAVYQYYRHGERHPILAEQRKHYALVIDFGGGTFDVCLIETTKTGDVAAVGNRMAKPLAASSKSIGGYAVNRNIAEHLIRKLPIAKTSGGRLAKGFQEYSKWRRDGTDISTLGTEYQHFIRNLNALAYRIEDAKLALSRTIRNWKLDAAETASVPVAVPSDPFSSMVALTTIYLSASDFREVFLQKVWNAELKNTVKLTLERGRQESNGANVSVVLLSGGSANIRWLAELVRRDFASELQFAETLSIRDYQEVVSKGLAIECARRYFTPDATGDFSATTYNRLCLLLEPDSAGCDIKRFSPKDIGLPIPEIPGVLIPSATALGGFRDKPMSWKVRLESAPKHQLHYYFLKSSFDKEDHQNLQNVEETCVYTPRNARFDSHLTVELLIAKDGTATPKFTYFSGRTESESISTSGRPFFLDMTSTESIATATAYIGLDFGTSNTSLSFVSHERIQVYERRSQESSWSELSELASTLPYPLAAPLAEYLVQTDPGRLAVAARKFIESALTLAAYITFLDTCSSARRDKTHFLKNLSKRSAGPIWGMLKQLLESPVHQTGISLTYQKLKDPVFFKEIEDSVRRISDQKHDKIEDEAMHALRPVQILANISQELFSQHTFGMFNHVRKKRFGVAYEGIFRRAHGRPPFVESSIYEGTIAFSNDETFLISKEDARSISLEPLILWHHCPKHPELENGHCFVFDSCERDGTFTYVAVGHKCTLVASPHDTDTSSLHEVLASWKITDPRITVFEVKLRQEDRQQ